MTVESIGNIADVYSNGKLPQRGMIISATKEELMAFSCNLLYREVTVATTEKTKIVKDGVKGAPDAETLYKMFYGIKPMKSVLKKADSEARHHEESEVK